MIIEEEYNSFVEEQYAGKSLEERQKLDIKKNDTLLDPCLGAGGLLAAAIITKKVKPEDCYGIELDADILKIAQKRLSKLGVPSINLHRGNALNPRCYEFKDGYKYDAENDTVTTIVFSERCSGFGQRRARG